MMILDLKSLLDQSESLRAQIDFCELMAGRFASHDRDVSLMYQSIATTLRNLETPSSPTTTHDDRASYNSKKESQLDPRTNQNNEPDAGFGIRNSIHAEKGHQS